MNEFRYIEKVGGELIKTGHVTGVSVVDAMQEAMGEAIQKDSELELYLKNVLRAKREEKTDKRGY